MFRGRTHQLCHSVDIDLSLLQASTEEHGRRHQKVVSYAVSINVQRCDLAAVVGADLEETCMQSEFAGEYVLFVDSHVVFGGTDDLELIIYSNIESKWEVCVASKQVVRVVGISWMLRRRRWISHWSGRNIIFVFSD